VGTYIFAYGTLRTGASNHHIAGVDSNTKSLGIKELKGYKMYSVPNNGMGSKNYPGIVWTSSENDIIVGELFEVIGSDENKASFIESLDQFENDAEYPEYKRELIEVDGVSAYCYIYILDIAELDNILTGDWLSR
jgi:gamma-glutamylcyclotransferase (GGCT)/AIG2-like uncharacterized protein YtfP